MLNYNKYVDIAMVSFLQFHLIHFLGLLYNYTFPIIKLEPFFKVDMNLLKSQSFLPIFVKPICVGLRKNWLRARDATSQVRFRVASSPARAWIFPFY